MTSNDVLVCPDCGSPVTGYDHVSRKAIFSDGITYTIILPRVRCTNPNCGKYHRVLPQWLSKNKHYVTDVIEKFLDDPDEQYAVGNDYLSEQTIERWQNQFQNALDVIKNNWNTIQNQLTDLPAIVLQSVDSLLQYLRRDNRHGWFNAVVTLSTAFDVCSSSEKRIFSSGGYLNELLYAQHSIQWLLLVQ